MRGKVWRECMGVEPTRDRLCGRATVLKTAEATGPPPLPRERVDAGAGGEKGRGGVPVTVSTGWQESSPPGGHAQRPRMVAERFSESVEAPGTGFTCLSPEGYRSVPEGP